jgi:hypothetical protein
MAKRLHYHKLVINPKNKMKTTWNIDKSITGSRSEEITSVSINAVVTEKQQLIEFLLKPFSVNS